MMNCIKKVVYLFTLSITISVSSLYGVQNEARSNAILHARTIQHLEAIVPFIVDILHELYMHEDYWKRQKLTPLAYFLSKDPTKWIYQKAEWQRMDSNLAFLHKEQEHNAYYLGLFNQYLQDKNSYFYHNEASFITVLESLEHFLSYYPHSSRLYTQKNRETITQRVDRNEYLLSYYKKNARRAYVHCSEPNHFQRNWLGYTLAALVCGSGLYFIYQNKSKLENWFNTGVEGIKKYYYEHVSNPLSNALKSIFDKNRDPLIVKEGVIARKNALEDAIRRHYTIFSKDTPEEAIDTIVAEALDGNLNKLLQRENVLVEKILNTPNIVLKLFTNQEYMREVLSCFNINKQSALLQKDIGALDIENLKNAQALNIELIAVLPSALLGYLSYIVGKTLFNNIIMQKNTYQPLRKALRRLHIIFNRYNTQIQQDLSLADQGFVYYWIEQFKKHSKLISLNDRKMILEDLQELASKDFTIQQKLNVISRMYYNYSFLLPSNG